MAMIICNSISLINFLHSKTVNERRSIRPRDRTRYWNIMEFKSISQRGTSDSFNTAMLLTCDLPSSDK